MCFLFFLPSPFSPFCGYFRFPASFRRIDRKETYFPLLSFLFIVVSEDPPPFGDEWGFMCVKKEGKEADGSGRMQKAEILIFSKGNKITQKDVLLKRKTLSK